MTKAIHFSREVHGALGRYVARLDSVAGEAELNFSMPAPDLMSADHAYAPHHLRGTGVSSALVGHMVADARAGGFKVRPLCSYVRAQFGAHPEWADVLA
jgi:predicted GNAT family acetyltransferase